jgi:sugar phosphate isomerase/epimerase
MMRAAVTVSLVPEARGGPFVFWNDLTAGFASAAGLGFEAVEIFTPEANAVPLSTVKGLMESHSLKLAAVGTGAGWVKHKLRVTDPDPAIREQARRFVMGIINFAGILGAPAILGSMQGRWGDGVSREQALEWLAEALRAFGERATGHGTCFLYEPLNRYETNLLNRAADAAQFLETRSIKNVKLLCDLFHMNIEEADIAAALRRVAPLLGHVHWADSNRLAVGLGHTDIAPIAQALRDIGYAGYLSAEVLPLPDSEAAAQQTIASIRALRLGKGSAQPRATDN